MRAKTKKKLHVYEESLPSYQDQASSLKLNSPAVPQKHRWAFLAPEH